MLCLERLKFSPRSMATFSLHEVVINFKLTVYCWKGLKKKGSVPSIGLGHVLVPRTVKQLSPGKLQV